MYSQVTQGTPFMRVPNMGGQRSMLTRVQAWVPTVPSLVACNPGTHKTHPTGLSFAPQLSGHPKCQTDWTQRMESAQDASN